MPKAPIAAALSKLALDVGAELYKDEDVRKMSKKVMEQLRSQSTPSTPSAGSSKLKDPGSKSSSHKPSKSGSSGASSSRRTASHSKSYADAGRSRRPGLPQRTSHDSHPGSGRSSPTARHHRAQLIQPGVPAEYSTLDDGQVYGRIARTSKSAGATPLASPALTPQHLAPARHRALLDAQLYDTGYRSDGSTAPKRVSSFHSVDPEVYAQLYPDSNPRRERSNSVGEVQRPAPTQRQSSGGYFAQGPGRMSRVPSRQDTSPHRLPAPPTTPPVSSVELHPVDGVNHSASPLAQNGLVKSSQGTNVVLPRNGTKPSLDLHALEGSGDAPASPRRWSATYDGSTSKRNGKKTTTATASASSLTPSQSYDALASSRQRIGAGVPLSDVLFAARCANLIYSLFDLDDTQRYLASGKDKLERHPTLVDVVFSDPGQGIKNWALWRRKADGALVISVRGTSRGPDWVDDMLSHLKEKEYALEKASTLRCGDGSVFYAHSSFLKCAVAMVPEVCRLLTKRLAKDATAGSTPLSGSSTPTSGTSPYRSRRGASASGGAGANKLIITGHSAGGAVASLLYLLLEHHYSSLLAKFSQVFCITFGSAACVRRTRPLTTRPSDQVLAFILRGDPVPRLDMNYGLYLLEHYARLPGGNGAGAGAGSASLAAAAMGRGDGDGSTTTAARDLDGETFFARLTALYGSERQAEGRQRHVSASDVDNGEGEVKGGGRISTAVEVPLQDLFPAGEMLMIEPGGGGRGHNGTGGRGGEVWEIDAERLEGMSPIDVSRHEMRAYQRALEEMGRVAPRLVFD